MAHYDLPLAQLESYDPQLPEPPDLVQFWDATLTEARAHPLDVHWTPVDSALVCVRTYDVSYPGFAGEPVRGWLHLPVDRSLERDGRLPAVVQYQGYGGGRGRAHENILWAAAGYAHLIMDTRGQGGAWSASDTADPAGSGPSHPGFLTRGLADRNDYYYRRVFTDAVRAVEAIRSRADVDTSRVFVAGASQGGGLALATAALVTDVAGALVDVPFLTHIRRAIEVTDEDPYGELARFLAVQRTLVERAFETLSYFDVAVLARRAVAPALFSVALSDPICPPSTVFAAYNAYAGPKEIRVYPYNGHEGGAADHQVEQLRWLRARSG